MEIKILLDLSKGNNVKFKSSMENTTFTVNDNIITGSIDELTDTIIKNYNSSDIIKFHTDVKMPIGSSYVSIDSKSLFVTPDNCKNILTKLAIFHIYHKLLLEDNLNYALIDSLSDSYEFDKDENANRYVKILKINSEIEQILCILNKFELNYNNFNSNSLKLISQYIGIGFINELEYNNYVSSKYVILNDYITKNGLNKPDVLKIFGSLLKLKYNIYSNTVISSLILENKVNIYLKDLLQVIYDNMEINPDAVLLISDKSFKFVIVNERYNIGNDEGKLYSKILEKFNEYGYEHTYCSMSIFEYFANYIDISCIDKEQYTKAFSISKYYSIIGGLPNSKRISDYTRYIDEVSKQPNYHSHSINGLILSILIYDIEKLKGIDFTCTFEVLYTNLKNSISLQDFSDSVEDESDLEKLDYFFNEYLKFILEQKPKQVSINATIKYILNVGSKINDKNKISMISYLVKIIRRSCDDRVVRAIFKLGEM